MEGFPQYERAAPWGRSVIRSEERIGPYFERAEPRQRVMAYLRGSYASPNARTAGS